MYKHNNLKRVHNDFGFFFIFNSLTATEEGQIHKNTLNKPRKKNKEPNQKQGKKIK